MRLQIGTWVRAGAAIGLLCLMGTSAQSSSIGVTHTVAAGVPVLVMTVDLADTRVKVTGMVAQGGCGKAEKFEAMVHRTHPTAAVTGTYFCERTLLPIGDIVVNGHLAHRGGVGTGLAITDDNRCEFVKPPHRYARMDWNDYDFVCCSGPRLVHDGASDIHPQAEGFHDSHLLGYAPRLAVGLTANNKLLFVATRKSIQLGQLARALKKLGCVDAINLDAGGSLGVYKGGKMLMHPNRRLTNLILIYDDRGRYDRFKNRLTPLREIARK